MLDWLTQDITHGPEIGIDVFLFRLVLALVLGCVVAVVYRATHRNATAATPGFLATLVMLSILLAIVTQVIGNSAARAFSLAGVLAIVRFRTVVEDTRDTAFVIFAVVIGMAVGGGHLLIALVGLFVVSFAAILIFFLYEARAHVQELWQLQVRIGMALGAETPWAGLFASHLDTVELQSTATARQGAALELTYRVRLKPGSTPLQILSEMNRLEGIQNLELRRV